MQPLTITLTAAEIFALSLQTDPSKWVEFERVARDCGVKGAQAVILGVVILREPGTTTDYYINERGTYDHLRCGNAAREAQRKILSLKEQNRGE